MEKSLGLVENTLALKSGGWGLLFLGGKIFEGNDPSLGENQEGSSSFSKISIGWDWLEVTQYGLLVASVSNDSGYKRFNFLKTFLKSFLIWVFKEESSEASLSLGYCEGGLEASSESLTSASSEEEAGS